MNNVTLKKWIWLSVLLVITLILVWQAPQPQQTVPVVSATRDRAEPVSSSLSENEQLTEQDIVLKQRQMATEKVDLFNTPVIKKPEIVIAKPEKKKNIQQQVKIPFIYMGMLDKKDNITLFLLEDKVLHLVKEGDILNQQFQLQSIDLANEQLVWLYLPTNETRKMSIKK